MKQITKAFLCALLGAALLLGLAACGAAPAAEAQELITVSASAAVRLTPDKAAISFGVTTQEPGAAEAQSKNAEAVKRVVDVLTARGVAEKSIRTTNYYMYPQYDYSYDGDQRIIGYLVCTTMSVEDQDIESLGQLLSACVEAGINSVDSVRFLCSGYDEAYRQALAQAVEAARDKAGALAAAAGKRLGDAVSVSEGWQDTSARYGRQMDGVPAAYATDEAAFEPSLQPGETEITANVTVSFSMK